MAERHHRCDLSHPLPTSTRSAYAAGRAVVDPWTGSDRRPDVGPVAGGSAATEATDAGDPTPGGDPTQGGDPTPDGDPTSAGDAAWLDVTPRSERWDGS